MTGTQDPPMTDATLARWFMLQLPPAVTAEIVKQSTQSPAPKVVPLRQGQSVRAYIADGNLCFESDGVTLTIPRTEAHAVFMAAADLLARAK